MELGLRVLSQQYDNSKTATANTVGIINREAESLREDKPHLNILNRRMASCSMSRLLVIKHCLTQNFAIL